MLYPNKYVFYVGEFTIPPILVNIDSLTKHLRKKNHLFFKNILQENKLNAVMFSSVMDFAYVLDLASNGKASQSSTFNDVLYGALKAIDGITEFPNCTHTSEEPNPFLKIDLTSKAEVFRITVFNRIDKIDPEVQLRLRNFSILVGESTNKFENCVSHGNMSHDVSKVFECHLFGHFVKLQSHVDDYLNICELMIFGRYVAST